MIRQTKGKASARVLLLIPPALFANCCCIIRASRLANYTKRSGVIFACAKREYLMFFVYSQKSFLGLLLYALRCCLQMRVSDKFLGVVKRKFFALNDAEMLCGRNFFCIIAINERSLTSLVFNNDLLHNG